MNEIQRCKHNNVAYLCDLAKPIMHLSKDEMFCQLEGNQCRLDESRCRNVWIELYDPSEYLYFCCNTYQLRFICEDQIAKRQLSNAGIITIGLSCIAKGDDFSLYPQRKNSNILNIAPNIMTMISLPKIEIDNNGTDYSVNITLQNLHQQIMGIKEKANELPDSISSHDIHHYSFSYSLLAIAIIAAIIFFWRRRRQVVASRRQANRNSRRDECSEVHIMADRKPSVVHFSARSDQNASEGQVFFTNSSSKLYRDSCNSPIPIKHDFERENTHM